MVDQPIDIDGITFLEIQQIDNRYGANKKNSKEKKFLF
jgi:hypothetical protein